jgi:hypothetical protein
MKTIIFEKLKLLNLFLMIFLRIFGYKIFFVKISKYLQNKYLLNILKKIDLNWFNYQEYNLNTVETFQMQNFLSYASQISDLVSKKFYKNEMNKKFTKENYFKISLEFNLKKRIFECLEIVKINDYLNYNFNIKYIWAEKDIVSDLVFKKNQIININRLKIEFLELFPLLIVLFIKFGKNKLVNIFNQKEKINEKKNKERDFETVYFPHDLLTSGLYQKNFFYFESRKHLLNPNNILHIEWNDTYLTKENKKFYREKEFNFQLWSRFSTFITLKNTLIFIYKNKLKFTKIFLWDYHIFKIICFSIFKLEKTDLFLDNFSKVKLILSGHSDLFPPEILISSRKRKIITISIEDRIVLSGWSSRLMFNFYLVAGKTSKKNLINKQHDNECAIINGLLFKSINIKKKFISEKKSFDCLVTDFHSEVDWYINGTSTINNFRLNKEFYEIVFELASRFNNINFMIKSKSYEWLDQKFYQQIVEKLLDKKNVLILKDQKKWTPEFSLNNCDFLFGLHSSLLDEGLASGKPIIIFDRSNYPSKIFDYGKELLSEDLQEIIQKFEKLTYNFDDYNKSLDKCRSLLFYNIDQEKYKKEIEKIIYTK